MRRITSGVSGVEYWWLKDVSVRLSAVGRGKRCGDVSLVDASGQSSTTFEPASCQPRIQRRGIDTESE